MMHKPIAREVGHDNRQRDSTMVHFYETTAASEFDMPFIESRDELRNQPAFGLADAAIPSKP